MKQTNKKKSAVSQLTGEKVYVSGLCMYFDLNATMAQHSGVSPALNCIDVRI